VAGGDQQDKQLYENLSSPTVATSSVFIIAAIAASEGRPVEVVDITGAYLNASIKGSGPKVHMELNKTLTSMMVKLDSSYLPFVKPDGTVPLVCMRQNCQNENIKIWTLFGHFHPKMRMSSANWMLHKLFNNKIIYQTLLNCVNRSKTMFSQGGYSMEVTHKHQIERLCNEFSAF
jgi:hypothetical protein